MRFLHKEDDSRVFHDHQTSSEEHSEQGDDLQVEREGASVELHQGADQTTSAEESAGS